MTADCVLLKDLPDVKGQNSYLEVCSLFLFQFFLIFIIMSNENQICSLHFIPHCFQNVSLAQAAYTPPAASAHFTRHNNRWPDPGSLTQSLLVQSVSLKSYFLISYYPASVYNRPNILRGKKGISRSLQITWMVWPPIREVNFAALHTWTKFSSTSWTKLKHRKGKGCSFETLGTQKSNSIGSRLGLPVAVPGSQWASPTVTLMQWQGEEGCMWQLLTPGTGRQLPAVSGFMCCTLFWDFWGIHILLCLFSSGNVGATRGVLHEWFPLIWCHWKCPDFRDQLRWRVHKQLWVTFALRYQFKHKKRKKKNKRQRDGNDVLNNPLVCLTVPWNKVIIDWKW